MNVLDKSIKSCDADYGDYEVSFTLVELKKSKKTMVVKAQGPEDAKRIIRHKFRNDEQYPTDEEVRKVR